MNLMIILWLHMLIKQEMESEFRNVANEKFCSQKVSVLDEIWQGLAKMKEKKTFSQLMFPQNVRRRIDSENRMSPGALLSPVWESCQCVNSNLIRGMGLKRARSKIGHRKIGAVPIISQNYCLLPGYLTWSLWRADRDTAAHLPRI